MNSWNWRSENLLNPRWDYCEICEYMIYHDQERVDVNWKYYHRECVEKEREENDKILKQYEKNL